MAHRPGIRFFAADGLDIYDTAAVARTAAEYVRRHRKPAFLHLRTVRLYGHAGADVATSYLPRAEVEADEANDPLLHSVRLMDAAGALDPDGALAIYDNTLARVTRVSEQAAARPRLAGAADVMASIVPPKRACRATNFPARERRAEAFGAEIAAMDDPQPMSRLINWALTDLMLETPEVVLMGEDVGRKGGVYGVTQKLFSNAVRARPGDRHAAGRAVHPGPGDRHGA